MIGVDRIAWLPTTEEGFYMIQNHDDMLLGKVHAVPNCATATAAEAAEIIRDIMMFLRSCDLFPNVLVVDPNFTNKVLAVFRAFIKSMGSCLIVGSAYHKNTYQNYKFLPNRE
jgi:hypothetical protein